jgi:uncharacterized repeat protein (TIGR03803 family)
MSKFLELSAKCFLGCGLVAAMSVSGAEAKSGDTVLHSFCTQQDCTDGTQPLGGVIADAAGNLYGTTGGGGANQQGTVFKLAPDGTYSLLYSFCAAANCTDGAGPSSQLIMDGSGNLYGTTMFGGANQGGTVFRLATDGTETVIHSFCSVRHCRDGQWPQAGLIMDGAGNLYGTTLVGGIKNEGTVFTISANGEETVLYSFRLTGNAAGPTTNLVMDGAGNLYGTTQSGSHGGPGIAFEVSSSGAFKQLYAFCSKANCADGSNPEAGLIMDGSGNLYGTTLNGGANGYGAVFKLATSGAETVLYSFCSKGDCSDGAYPAASLIMDSSGNLYGTTQYGNGRDCSENNFNTLCGTVFRLATDGTETTLYSFCGKADCTDGSEPAGNLIMDGAGNLYGTTTFGGKGDCIGGCGTVFTLSSGGKKE